jgi:DNA-binding NtrC family response regulator
VLVNCQQEAYEKLDTGDAELLFVDLRMPEGNGAELVKRIGSIRTWPRIVVSSVFITLELEAEFKGKSMGVFRKPFQLDGLDDVLENFQQSNPIYGYRGADKMSASRLITK